MGFLLSYLSFETTINRSLAAAGSSTAQAEVAMHSFTIYMHVHPTCYGNHTFGPKYYFCLLCLLGNVWGD